jgi:hypothetical protein
VRVVSRRSAALLPRHLRILIGCRTRRPGHDRHSGPDRTPVHPRRHARPKKTFAATLAAGNHLLVQLKDNQTHLLDAAHAITASAVPADTAASTTIGRHRRERRSVEVFPVGKALAETEWVPFINTIIRVTRRPWLRCAATGMWDQRGGVACYVSSSSAAGLQASAWADIIPGH